MSILETELQEQRAFAETTLREAKKRGNELIKVTGVGLEDFEHPRTKQTLPALKVYFEGIYGYIPKALIDDYDFKSLQSYASGEYYVLIEDVLKDEHDVFFVANRKDALVQQAKHFWKTAKKGYEYDAFVSGVDRVSIWLLINGVRVKMPRVEYSYSYVLDLRDEVFLGDTLQVKILSIDAENQKVTVSRRILEADPRTFLKDYKEGGVYSATIENIDSEQMAVFVSLSPKKVTAVASIPPIRAKRFIEKGAKVNYRIKRIDVEKGHIHGVIIVPQLGQISKMQGRPYGN